MIYRNYKKLIESKLNNIQVVIGQKWGKVHEKKNTIQHLSNKYFNRGEDVARSKR